jgi:hypothetical protein
MGIDGNRNRCSRNVRGVSAGNVGLGIDVAGMSAGCPRGMSAWTSV